MKMMQVFRWLPLCSGLLLASLGVAQSKAEAFKPNAFPGYVVEEVVVPVPSEIFAVLDKLGDPNWKDEVRSLKTLDTSVRTELALNFGSVIAEGFVSVQAQDKQAVDEIGREVLSIAKALGLEKAVRPHAQSILDAVDKKDWKGVRKEFDQTQATVRAEMERMRDNDLAQCVSLGGWLRGTASVTSVIGKAYTEDRAELLNQKMLVDHFAKAAASMSTNAKNSKIIGEIRKGLAKIQADMGNEDDIFTLEKVKSISRTCEDLLKVISPK